MLDATLGLRACDFWAPAMVCPLCESSVMSESISVGMATDLHVQAWSLRNPMQWSYPCLLLSVLVADSPVSYASYYFLSDTTVMIAWSLILEIQALMLGTVFLRLGQQKSKARVIKQVLLVWNPEPLLRSFRGSWISGDFRVLRLGAGSFHLAWTPNNLKPASFISCQPIHGIRSTEAGSESQVIPNRS